MSYFTLTEREREKELIESERSKIEETIQRLSADIQKEENEREKKKQVFVEDLDKQVEEKKTSQSYQERKEQMFRDTNALADKLSKFKIDEPVIAVSEILLLKNPSVFKGFLLGFPPAASQMDLILSHSINESLSIKTDITIATQISSPTIGEYYVVEFLNRL